MSRITVRRHPNGGPELEAGYDRPMAQFFVDRYDDEGEYVDGIGLFGSGPCRTPGDASDYLVEQGVDLVTAGNVTRLLEDHVHLDYPASNVTVDLT